MSSQRRTPSTADFHADGRRKSPEEFLADLKTQPPALLRLIEATRRRARKPDGSVKSSAELIAELRAEEPELMAEARAMTGKRDPNDSLRFN